ncbi:hypothetical protein N8A98_08650 [Devosia neptuniae]|uniref:Poly(3-hydroxyalkanoate) polymerase subunit PhaE n=1 Tax=Devosia neptuniae TaxID=191302 RepID=A0ABY6CGE3_9HYPH|nr:hypothetical protein [Devosia neptuniae]UXN71230.1 hypothetical protein N8A98_08650 [Devosia neptuniae]
MPQPKKLPRVTHALAARHEALWLRLTALHAQIATVAARRPQAPVSGQTISVAEVLLRDAQVFLAQGDSLPMAAPDHGGLLTQLGQALAGLDAWEAVNAEWRGELNAFVWKVVGDPVLPVQRLRPKLVAAAAPHADPAYAAYKAKMADLRDKLALRIDQFRNR